MKDSWVVFLASFKFNVCRQLLVQVETFGCIMLMGEIMNSIHFYGITGLVWTVEYTDIDVGAIKLWSIIFCACICCIG